MEVATAYIQTEANRRPEAVQTNLRKGIEPSCWSKGREEDGGAAGFEDAMVAGVAWCKG